METILGKASAIFNGHQPPGADDPYMLLFITLTYIEIIIKWKDLG